ncbi:hypothetical protein LguiB_036006 [Lonicera macranthoides]
MAGRSIALGRRCRTCLNRECIRYSIPSSIPQSFDSKVYGGLWAKSNSKLTSVPVLKDVTSGGKERLRLLPENGLCKN